MTRTDAGCIVPFKGYASVRPREAGTDDGPCGKKIVTSVGGVDVSAESLCLPHWTLKHGHSDLKPPVVVEP
jgi:hypothetical protein